MSQSTRRVLVYGGNGALGSKCVSKFKSNNWWIVSVALQPVKQADVSILVLETDSFEEQERKVLHQLKSSLGQNKLDAIICAAGGWAGGNVTQNLVHNSKVMWQKNVWTSVIGASVAGQYLNDSGVLAFVGSSAAVNPDANLLAYSISKVAVHHLTRCLGKKGSGIPANSICAAILPHTLDSPSNRAGRPNADTSTWTSLDFCADLLWSWAINKERPASGSLVQLVTTNHKTDLVTY